MPGLAAIEVLLLALPWSLLLGRPPIAQAGVVIAGGLVVRGSPSMRGSSIGPLAPWSSSGAGISRGAPPDVGTAQGSDRWAEDTRLKNANVA